MPYFVFLSFHPSSHTLAHMFKISLALSTVLILAFYGSLKNFLSVPHSLVVKCMVAYLFSIPSDNRHYSLKFQILMFFPFDMLFPLIMSRPKIIGKNVLFCDFYFLNLFNVCLISDYFSSIFPIHTSLISFPGLRGLTPSNKALSVK